MEEKIKKFQFFCNLLKINKCEKYQNWYIKKIEKINEKILVKIQVNSDFLHSELLVFSRKIKSLFSKKFFKQIHNIGVIFFLEKRLINTFNLKELINLFLLIKEKDFLVEEKEIRFLAEEAEIELSFLDEKKIEFFNENKTEIEFFLLKSLDLKVYLKVISKNNDLTEKLDFFYRKYQEIISEKRISFLSHKLKPNSEVKVIGEIFSIIEGTNYGKKWTKIYISDYKESIFCYFSGEKKDLKIKEKDVVLIHGKISVEKKTSELMISGISLEKLPSFSQDCEEEKRIELFAKTNMNAMDGVSSLEDYINLSKYRKLKYLGISDLDSVQAFPEFYNLLKNDKDLFPIYGSTFSVVYKINDLLNNLEIYKNSKRKTNKISNENYIVFDLETTGLSPFYDEIIEFAAIKIHNGILLEKMHFLVKPTKPLDPNISKITKIYDRDLENAIDQKEAIKKILDFCQDDILVAHNANFDYSFLLEKSKIFNLKKVENIYIDTLWISRFLYPENKKHKLSELAKRLSVNYDTSESHRANYDADVLWNCWKKIISLLEDKKIFALEHLLNVNFADLHKFKFRKEISIIAKNQKGLKKIFKLISKSSIQKYSENNFLFVEEIKKDKDLIICSGGYNSLIWETVFFDSHQKLEKLLQKFDFIQIIPPTCLSYLQYQKNIKYTEILKGIKKVVELAQKLNIKMVASSEPRYAQKEQKIIHEIYINTKGLKGIYHPLYNFNSEKTTYPDFYFMNTQELKNEFAFLENEDLVHEIVVKNSHKIASQVEKIEIIKKELYSPKFDNSHLKLPEFLEKRAREKYGDYLPDLVKNRISKEIHPILKYNYDSIYWIAQKLVTKSLQDGYVVGSRGSIGSSFVAYLIGITEVNPLPCHYVCEKCFYFEVVKDKKIKSGWDLPLKNCPSCEEILDQDGHNIPFETFLGFEGDKIPDIDLNFSGEYQLKIHNYTRNLFDKNHTFRAGTISTNASKTAYAYVKKYEEKFNLNLSKNYVNFLTTKCSGIKRTTGQHPGGIIIIPKNFEVEDFTPVNYPANDKNAEWQTTHLDFHAIHDNVLKLDLLGHDDPTMIKMLEDLTGFSVKNIPKNDQNVMSLFSSLNILNIKPEDIGEEKTGARGIPEFGTAFVRQLLDQTRPKTFADLISISGLSHGTDVWKGNAEKLVKKHKFSLDKLISCRDDIMTFLISKKIPEKMAFDIMEQVRKGKGLTLADKNYLQKAEIPDWYIESMEKIKYMFPKAHATAYVIMAWRIAFYKLHFPLEYYCAFLSTRTSVFDLETVLEGKAAIDKKILFIQKNQYNKSVNIAQKDLLLLPSLLILQEALARGIKIFSLDLRKSDDFCWIIDQKNNALLPPFITVDGLGETAAASIKKARKEKFFISIEDFANRTSVNSTIINKLKQMGLFQGLQETNQLKLF